MSKRSRKRRKRLARGTRRVAPGCILVIDDDIGFLDYATRMLKLRGYDVVTECNGADALATIERASPDLILCDVMMPGVNGFQLCRQLKDAPHTQGIKIALMSSKTDPVNRYWAEELGAATLIAKPFEHDAVLSELDELLDSAHEQGRTRP